MTSSTEREPVGTAPAVEPVTAPTRAERREVLRREKQRFGGIKWGSAFFGWLTAVGTAVLLGGIAAAVAQGYALSGDTVPGTGVGVVAVAVTGVVLFVAYFCGGYVAGRMARFSGAMQGVAVWVWAVVVAIAVAVLVSVSGAAVNLAPVSGLIGGRVDPTALTVGGLVALAAALIVGLAGAVLGGLAGMRFHRRVDRAAAADPGPVPTP